MTFLGKILSVLILVMSVLFLGFSVAVFATHTNWRDKAKELQAAADEAKRANSLLQDELQRQKDALAREEAARRFAIANIRTRADASAMDLAAKEKELQDLIAAHAALEVTNRSLAEQLGMLTTEVADLRGDVRKAIDDRNQQFTQVVKLTEDLVSIKGTHDLLAARNDVMTKDLAHAEGLLGSVGLTLKHAVPDSPPDIEGFVRAVNDQDLIEISLGNDDGLRKGHELVVYRGRDYVARVVVREVRTDFAVAEVIPSLKRIPVQKGDRVATKLIKT